MAGESARESAQRQREKAARLQRSADLWERGAAGEEATADALAALPAEGWTVLHDVAWPGRPRANIDHVVVGRPGVFVVDSKNWSGEISIRGDALFQNGRSRAKTITGAATAGLAVGGLSASLPPGAVHPVLCFLRDEPLAAWVGDVVVCSTGTLADLLTSRPPMLTPEQVEQVSDDLDAGFRAAAAAKVAPVATTERRGTSAPRSSVTSPKRRTTTGRRRKRKPRVTTGELVRVVLSLTILVGLFADLRPIEWLAGQLAALFVG